MRYGFSSHKTKASKAGCDSTMSSAGNIDLLVDNKRINSIESSIHQIPQDGQTSLTNLLTNNSCHTYNDHEERHPSFGTNVKTKKSDTTLSNLDFSLPSSPRQEFTFQNLPRLSNSLIPSLLQTKPNSRSASPRQATVKHPTPGSKTLQGAHIKTIENLERTAELLSKDSFTGKSTENLLDKDLANPLDGLPPRSSSRTPLGSRLHSTLEDTKYSLLVPPKSPLDTNRSPSGSRPSTSPREKSAMDIIEKMFDDFDGTHLDQTNSDQRLTQNPGGRNSQRLSSAERLSYADSEIDPKMIFYPAPVPSVLNLPKRLSKRPTSSAFSNRNSQSSCTLTQNLISLQSGLAKQDVSDNVEEYKYLSPKQATAPKSIEKNRQSQYRTSLSPHLLANQFFEHQNPTQEVLELKDDSAVATLDGILDASAHTPVSAFTDHVFARNSVRLSWSEQKQNSTLSYLKGQIDKPSEEVDDSGDQDEPSKDFETKSVSMNTTSLLDPAGDLGISFEPLEDLKLGEKLYEDETCDETCENEVFVSPPTTLLAELQMRKQRQKQRTQPLTKTFPNGIHSTLLELDTAIQTEQKSRRKGRTILAWEDPAAIESQAAMQDDEDVPLGILYPKNVAKNRPIGLLEKRELEDKESLSQRQNRLRNRLALSNRMDSYDNLTENNGLLANNSQASRTFKKPHQLPLIDSAKTKNLADLPPTLASPNSVALPYFEKTAGSLLAIHERQAALRSASIQNLKNFSGCIKPQQTSSHNFNGDFHNQGVNQFYHLQQHPGQHSASKTSVPIYPTQPISGNYAVGQSWGTNFNGFTMGQNNINPNIYMRNMSMNMPVLQPVEQGQMDRVERWRQSITPLVKPSV